MRKNFQYRIFPTKKQLIMLESTLEECRWLYNHLLEKRKSAYTQEGKSLSCYKNGDRSQEQYRQVVHHLFV